MTRARRRPSRPAVPVTLAARFATVVMLVAFGCAREAFVPARPPEVRLKPHEEVVLDGSGSFDPEGEDLSYRWRQVAGPEVELKGADTPWPRFTPTGPGRYEFELVVAAPPEGGEGRPLEGPPVRLSVDILPPNRPPRVEIAPVVRAEPGQWAVLDGGGVEDPDGDVISFLWEVVGGEVKGSTLPPKTFIEMAPFDGRDRRVRVRGWCAGVYRFRLTATDAFGEETTGETLLLVAPNDLPPVGIPRVKGGASGCAPGATCAGGRLAIGHLPLRLGAWPHPEGGVNEPPVAVARAGGPDADGEFVLDGAASSDPNGDALEFRWEQTAGPRVRVLRPLDASAPHAAPDAREVAKGLARVGLTPPAPGRYAFSLVVSDGVLKSEPAEVAFVVAGEAAAPPTAPPLAPAALPEGIPPIATETTSVTADAGADVTVETGVEVALDGRRSRAPRGAKLAHDWRQVAGPRVTSFRLDPVEESARPRFAPEEAGQYEFELRVSADRLEWSAPDRVRVTVLGANRPPWIEAPGVVLARAGEVVRVAASWGDPDGDPTCVEWRRVGRGRATLTEDEGVAELEAPEDGCALEATVRDSRGGRARAIVNVRVPGEGRAPVAVARAGGDVRPGGRVLLDGAESYDPEGKPLEFHWDVAGTTLVRLDGRERAIASFRAPAAGAYEFRLVVSASGRESTPALVAVEVPEPDAAEGTGIVLSPVPARVTAGGTVVLDASRTMWDSARPRVTWTQVAGPRVAPAAEGEGAAPDPITFTVGSPRVVVRPTEPGPYRFRVEADVPGFAPLEVGFEVVEANAKPRASACAAVGRGGRVVLDGSRSRDPEGATLRYRWTEVAGNALGLDGRAAGEPRLVLEDAPPGRHAVRLAVTDGERVGRSRVVEFRVDERPPGRERRP